MDELLPKALPVEVADGTENEDPKWDIPAQSAASYLKMVRQEASKCPDIVIAPNLDADKRSSSQNYFVASDSPLKAPPGLEPSIQWQIKQILEFSKLRDKLSKMKEVYEKPSQKGFSFPPDIRDGQKWVLWCCGKEILKANSDDDDPESKGDEGGDDDDDAVDQDDDDDDEVESNRSSAERTAPADGVASILSQIQTDDQTNSAFSRNPSSSTVEKLELKQGNPPLISVAMHMNQPMVESVLKHHCNHMNDRGFHIQQGPWIYALLALLQKPLSPDTCSTLRDLARICSQLRSGLDSASHPHLTPLNLFISIVARYFDQRDLADEPVSSR